jgi:hypothetical protein
MERATPLVNGRTVLYKSQGLQEKQPGLGIMT